MLLRCNVSSIAASRPASGSAMRLSSSVRVTRTSERNPGSSAGTTVAVSADSRSLACLALVAQPGQRADRRGACRIGVVGIGDAGEHVVEQRLVDPRRRRSRRTGRFRRSARGSRPASASVMLVPLPPRSTQRDDAVAGSPGAVCSAASAAASRGSARRAPRPVTGSAWPAAHRAARRRSRVPSVRAPRSRRAAPPPDRARHRVEGFDEHALADVGEPSAATSGTGSPTRSTKPVSTRPGWLSAGFSAATPTSGARSLNSVSTERRVTGRPADAGGHQVGRPDGQPESCAAHADSSARPPITIAARRRAEQADPPNGAKPLTPCPLTPAAAEVGSHRSRRSRPWIAS